MVFLPRTYSVIASEHKRADNSRQLTIFEILLDADLLLSLVIVERDLAGRIAQDAEYRVFLDVSTVLCEDSQLGEQLRWDEPDLTADVLHSLREITANLARVERAVHGVDVDHEGAESGSDGHEVAPPSFEARHESSSLGRWEIIFVLPDWYGSGSKSVLLKNDVEGRDQRLDVVVAILPLQVSGYTLTRATSISSPKHLRSDLRCLQSTLEHNFYCVCLGALRRASLLALEE